MAMRRGFISAKSSGLISLPIEHQREPVLARMVPHAMLQFGGSGAFASS
jgi:hypothetical protein